VRETGHHKPHSLAKVPKELLQLQQKVCVGINIFFVKGHIFFMTFSRKICFTTITHLINHKVSEVWATMHKIYQMYMLCGFHIVEIAGDGEFAWIADQVGSLPTTPILNFPNIWDWLSKIFVSSRRRLAQSAILFLFNVSQL
jgi:hypothetical protein